MKFIRLFLFLSCLNVSAQLPIGFVYVTDEIPSIKVELRYFSSDNFVGKPIDGYNDNVLILSSDATLALKKVQQELLKDSLSLKIFDAYRPQRAVNHFRKWAQNVTDTLTKEYFYPKVKKKNLFKDGYISTHSRHSSGSTLDITIVDLRTCKELDMGTAYDYFGKESWTHYQRITKKQQANRMLLKSVMNKYGFRNYPKEWWHFTLRKEPFLNQYFDFIVE
ncbi:MAG: M15 family metallopeptidase [Flavobacteriaceae bacterium]|nr:M15 family metallopeptidase [Flavobacteriaceae bacterium]